MIPPNMISPQVYDPNQLMMPTQGYIPQMPPPPVATYPMPAGTMPVYNSIPYSPVYGGQGTAPYCPSHQCMPDISTVKIELNGLEPPKVPGFNNPVQQQYSPVYPGMTQVAQPAYPQQMLPPQMPYMTPPVGMYPVPPVIPPESMAGMYPAQPQYQPIGSIMPPVAQIQPPAPQIAPPPPAIDNAPQMKTEIPATPAQENNQVKPLLEALSVISGKTGASIEEKGKAVETVAQFARVMEAASQLSKQEPNNPEIKNTKEKVDTLVKPNLIKEDTFIGLTNMALEDTSSLTGEQKAKADQNRIISMWTLSMLQKLFKQEMNEEAKKANLPPISMTEVPGIVQVVDIVQKDQNPDLREAGLAALVNLADPSDPKDKEVMKTILGQSQNDNSENVKKAAAEHLTMYK